MVRAQLHMKICRESVDVAGLGDTRALQYFVSLHAASGPTLCVRVRRKDKQKLMYLVVLLLCHEHEVLFLNAC